MNQLKPATPLPWTKISDHMLKEDGKTVNPNLPIRICQHCMKPASSTFEPASIQIATKGWGIASLCSLDPIREHDAHLQNARYIVHACNAYPELVAALRELVDLATVLARESADRARGGDAGIDPARALLAKLGE